MFLLVNNALHSSHRALFGKNGKNVAHNHIKTFFPRERFSTKAGGKVSRRPRAFFYVTIVPTLNGEKCLMSGKMGRKKMRKTISFLFLFSV
jgi:hypothetical protein